jgi:hypothetical protein
MLRDAMQWLTNNLMLLSAFGGLLVFFLWGARKKMLEIHKLKLEIVKLQEENLLYRPTQAEIEDMMRKCGKLPSLKLRFTEGLDILEEFSGEFREFLLQLLSHYGDTYSRKEIEEHGPQASVADQYDPYPHGIREHPDPKRVVSLWKASKSLREQRLEPGVIAGIDAFLGRYTHEGITVESPHDNSAQEE